VTQSARHLPRTDEGGWWGACPNEQRQPRAAEKLRPTLFCRAACSDTALLGSRIGGRLALRPFGRQHFKLSVAIGRTRGSIAIRSRHVGWVTLLHPRRTSHHQQTGADAQGNEHEHLSESHLTSLTAKVARTTLSFGRTIRKTRLEGRKLTPPGLALGALRFGSGTYRITMLKGGGSPGWV
jgi:hypothetical protein